MSRHDILNLGTGMPGVNDPLAVARQLAGVYGHKLDEPVMYTQGVALSGRLRLHALDPQTVDPSAEIAALVEPYVTAPDATFGPGRGTANLAGICWADELYDATGDPRYRDLLLGVADEFLGGEPGIPFAGPLDPDVRVEDMFFAGTLLGRAFRLTGDSRYVDVVSRFLLAADTQQPNGFWWHCRSSPYFWGRGNGFAAIGFAETLTYLPDDHPSRGELLARHLRHLEGLRAVQDSSGMWHQVLDEPGSYLEHSASSMIGNGLARGLRLGWLGAEWRPALDRTWDAVTSRIGPGGELEHVCGGTGPQPNLRAYLERLYSDGLDDRGGAMALWFAVEMARLRAGV